MPNRFHKIILLLCLSWGLTNCVSFAKSTDTIGAGISAITPEKDPAYNEERRGEYSSYQRYRKSYEAWQKKQQIEKLMKDKSLEKAF